MAEIKSTLELAMERTKKFTLTEEERKEIKQKEILQKASGLFHRYQAGNLQLNEILKEMGKMEKEILEEVKKWLLSKWIETLSLEEDPEKIFKAIDLFSPKKTDEIRKNFSHLFSQYQEEKREIEKRLKNQFLEELRAKGIFGDAVDPKLEGIEQWKSENEKLIGSYKGKLEEIKRELRSL